MSKTPVWSALRAKAVDWAHVYSIIWGTGHNILCGSQFMYMQIWCVINAMRVWNVYIGTKLFVVFFMDTVFSGDSVMLAVSIPVLVVWEQDQCTAYAHSSLR